MKRTASELYDIAKYITNYDCSHYKYCDKCFFYKSNGKQKRCLITVLFQKASTLERLVHNLD